MHPPLNLSSVHPSIHQAKLIITNRPTKQDPGPTLLPWPLPPKPRLLMAIGEYHPVVVPKIASVRRRPSSFATTIITNNKPVAVLHPPTHSLDKYIYLFILVYCVAYRPPPALLDLGLPPKYISPQHWFIFFALIRPTNHTTNVFEPRSSIDRRTDAETDNRHPSTESSRKVITKL